MSEEVVSMELPAPPGWKKQYFPKRRGTPRKNEIVFTTPTGEEIRNQRQLQQYLKAHPGGPPPSDFDWGTGETPRRSIRISEKPKAVSSAESEPPKKRGRKSSASKTDSNENEAADEEETKTGEVEMKDVETAEEEKTELGDEIDAQMEEAGKIEKEKTAGENEKDAQIQETCENKEKEPDTLKEVVTENQQSKETSAETKDSVSLDAKYEKDTGVPEAEGKKEAEDKDAEAKTGAQPQVPADTKDVSPEQVKPDEEEGKKEPTKIDGGVIPSVVTGHETDPVQMEKPQDKEQPPSDAVKKDSLEEPMKPDATINAEAKVNGTDPGLVQEPKSEINTKPVEATQNVTQAG